MPGDEFAKQIEDILYAYIFRKFSLSAADWHSHRRNELLRRYAVPESAILSLQHLLRRYDCIRFGGAPVFVDYQVEIMAAKNSILRMDETRMSVKKMKFTGKAWVLPFFPILFSTVSATVFPAGEMYRQAEKKYGLRQFDSAAMTLESLVRKGCPDAAIYSNLANSYARQKKTGQAILNYEKARHLAPDDTLVAQALQQLRQKNGLPAPVELPLARAIAYISPDALAWLAVACLFAGMLCLLVMAWQDHRLLYADEADDPATEKRYSARIFRSGLVLLALGMALLAGVYSVRRHLQGNRLHVVMDTATGYYAPSLKARELARLPEGSVVTVGDEFSGWVKVRITDGRNVWMQKRFAGAI